MNRMFRSATFKLTLWYLTLVMLISILFSVVIYHTATAELARGLHRESQRILAQYPVFNNTKMVNPSRDLATGTHRLLIRLLGFNIVVFVAAGFASYWLARRTLEPIEAAHMQQTRFTADVSHELRTPLTAMRMESEVALFDPASKVETLRDTLTSNLEEITKMEALINNLLRLSRLDENELQYNFTAIDIEAVINDAVAATGKQAERHNVAVKVQLTPASVMGDQESLTQLIVILLDNAIKYSAPAKTVHIKATRDGQELVLTIVDQGSGISNDALEHVFERFYRADNSRAKTTEGFGLGLSIAKLIADAHKSDITLSSRLGQGTTATLKLPISPQSLATDATN
jgi:two-component system sensor histidine kinase CiaH